MEQLLQEEYRANGLAKSEQFLEQNFRGTKDLRKAYIQLAKLCLNDSPPDAIRLGKKAHSLEPGDKTTKWLAFLLFEAGEISAPFELLPKVEPGLFRKPSEKRKKRYIEGCHTLLHGSIPLPKARGNGYSKNPKSILYIASSSLPYHITGYSIRTQGLLQAIKGLGWEIHCATRPGYPDDRVDTLPVSENNLSADLGYPLSTLGGGHRRDVPLDTYFINSAKLIAEKARETGASLLHAASNYEAGFPALMAARMLGIPFIYEVRGLWEYSSAAKIHGWEKTERFALDDKLESQTATGADFVFTLTSALSKELQSRGVKKEKIALVPNGFDPSGIGNAAGKPEGQTIAYMGSVVKYEGLDDLLQGFSILSRSFPKLKLAIIGDGYELPNLKRMAEDLQLGDKVIFTGKIPPAEVAAYYGSVDMVCLPRKPYKVCNLVSPLKPFEAMARGIPLVVSDVPPLMEIIGHGQFGYSFQAGDSMDLATVLGAVLENSQGAAKKAVLAKNHVFENHTWGKVASVISSQYEHLLA